LISIVDYNVGNAGSVMNMLAYLGIEAEITSDWHKIDNASKLIISGVGSFDNGMQNLLDSGLRDLLEKKVIRDHIPVLGICLGLQLMGRSSEEGSFAGMGWLDAESKRFDSTAVRTPHMSWNTVKYNKESKLFAGFENEARFYFAHSYYIETSDDASVAATAVYGSEFVAAVEKDNIAGVQFHPEKSHRYGMKLLKNFALQF
jgi:glutamine amidotransferase